MICVKWDVTPELSVKGIRFLRTSPLKHLFLVQLCATSRHCGLDGAKAPHCVKQQTRQHIINDEDG